MATKLTKSSLKGLIKECLIELLSEGLSTSPNALKESINDTSFLSKSKSNTNQQNTKSTKKQNKNPRFEDNAKQTIKNVTSDPVMAEIFADTANNTLQEQIQAEGKSAKTSVYGDNAAKAMDTIDDLSDIFGDATSNWANLAFENVNDKK